MKLKIMLPKASLTLLKSFDLVVSYSLTKLLFYNTTYLFISIFYKIVKLKNEQLFFLIVINYHF